MKKKIVPILLGTALIASAAYADELHHKAMKATVDLQHAIAEMHAIQMEHGGQFGGHLARAETLARQAEQERAAALDFYRARHPGWQ